MNLSKQLFIDIYDFLDKDINETSDYIEKMVKNFNFYNTDDLISQIKEFSSNDKFLDNIEEDLKGLGKDLISSVLKKFITKYDNYKKLEYQFYISHFNEQMLINIKTIELKKYYITCASDQLRLYKKEECIEINKFFIYEDKGKFINFYDMNIKFSEADCSINDMIKFSNNEIIVLFINYMFLFKIENDDLKIICTTNEKYKLIKCYKYNIEQVMVGTTENIVIFSKKNNLFQKLSVFNLHECYSSFFITYFFFKNLILIYDTKYIRIFSYDKKFKLKKIKKDFKVENNTRIKICYMKKINMFVLMKNTLFQYKLILTDLEKIYDEIKLEIQFYNIQDYSDNDEFILLFSDFFNKYIIENNKFKLKYSFNIKKINIFHQNNHILQISDDLYFVSCISGYYIYKIDKIDDEKKEINENKN